MDNFFAIHAEDISWNERFTILLNDLPKQLGKFHSQRLDDILDGCARFQVKRQFGLPGEYPGDAGKLDFNLCGIHIFILMNWALFVE